MTWQQHRITGRHLAHRSRGVTHTHPEKKLVECSCVATGQQKESIASFALQLFGHRAIACYVVTPAPNLPYFLQDHQTTVAIHSPTPNLHEFPPSMPNCQSHSQCH